MSLLSCWRGRGRSVVPFKKGPDYIDAAWLATAAGRPCYNLDPYLMSAEQILASYARRVEGVDGAVVEGNRGLFDGVDEHGTYSTAELAKLLGLPVVVVLDATKTTRTAAAMVLGLRALDPELPIAGVVLNQVGNARHESVLRRSVEQYGGVPVMGAMPRLRDLGLPERHLGLVPPPESKDVKAVVDRAAGVVSGHVDVEGLWELAGQQSRGIPQVHLYRTRKQARRGRARLGVIRDSAFHFYYPENLEALADAGMELVEIDAINDPGLPAVDGLYMGGGFPEMFASALADNQALRREIRSLVSEGLPVYAECGGLMYLGEGIRAAGGSYPMVGALPLWTEFTDRPQGHGYTVLETVGENPFIPKGEILRGHEFHYSKVVSLEESTVGFAFAVRRGRGLDGRRDGILRGNVLASYSHLHASSREDWAWRVADCVAARRGQGAGLVSRALP
jgi:cobyrinic acid a,c-diamide synthase